MSEAKKPFWASKTLWVNTFAMLFAVLAALGIDLGLDEEAQAKFTASAVAFFMGLANIILRLITKKPLTVEKEE